ncbi:RCC1 domain-containing protein, partial [Klebsiella pneumoniae]|uniref:RCC1 domain-containing protein n=1 Tax=Klebsiella pneumoniae TaxID=573 RepID=UPI0034D96EEE
SLALRENGTLWAWGMNIYGQLGDGTRKDAAKPFMPGLETDWSAVSAGLYHSLALKTNGTLWSCGDNTHGQLGDGTAEERTAFSQIGLDEDWV